MPIAPIPDPLPDNATYSFQVGFAGTETSGAGPSFFITWSPMYTGTGEDIPGIEAVVQDLTDRFSAVPGASVQVYKNRGFSQEFTPTDE